VLYSGEIIISGGSKLNGQKSKKIERLDIKEMTLKEIGEMKMSRSSHGMLQEKEWIYIIGGFNNN
jgi:hypothetical protein